MERNEETCWAVVQARLLAIVLARELFGRRYEPVILRDFGVAGGGNSSLSQQLDDAVQEVFVECFKAGGMLERLDPHRPGGFRAFLFGVARNVALRVDAGAAR